MTARVLVVTIGLFHCFSVTLPAQVVRNDSVQVDVDRRIDGIRLGLVLGVAGGLVAASHLQAYNSFWKGGRSGFHFYEDGAGYLGMDKIGHFYFANVVSDLAGRSLEWAGVQTSTALLCGASFAAAAQLYIEIEDGFTRSLGFSVGDFVADLSGAVYPLLQRRVPEISSLRLKWSAIKSDRYKRGEFQTIIDDYESQYYWLSYPLCRLLPRAAGKFIPPVLAVALGYGVKRLDGAGGGEAEFYVALDYDFEALPGEGDLLTSVKHLLNFIHFPSPMIRLTPSVVSYGFRW